MDIHSSHEMRTISDVPWVCMVCNACDCHNKDILERPCVKQEPQPTVVPVFFNYNYDQLVGRALIRADGSTTIDIRPGIFHGRHVKSLSLGYMYVEAKTEEGRGLPYPEMVRHFQENPPKRVGVDVIDRLSVQVRILSLVEAMVKERLDKSDPQTEFSAYIVWFCYILGGWKALVSTTLPDGRYYEVTYNKDKKETYVDLYVKVDNVCIPDGKTS